MSKTAYIVEGAITFEMTDTCGDGICCQNDASEFKMTEPVAINISSGEFQDVVRETFDVFRRNAGPALITGWISRTMNTRMR